MQFGVLGILCHFFTAYIILNHLNVNFSILIIWIWDGSDFVLLHVPISRNHGVSVRRFFLAHLSRRLIGELIVYEGIRRPSVVRLSTFSNDISSEALRPILFIFHI